MTATDAQPGFSLAARIGLVLGPVAALLFYFGPDFGWSIAAERPELNSMAAVAALMAIWWLTEAIPISATALVPLALFPLLKIPPGAAIAAQYGDPIIFLFLGGFLLALAIEESGVHRRVALGIVAAMGDRPRRIVLGFMVATAALSMWLSNTATTMMLLPIAASVLAQVDRQGGDAVRRQHFGAALMLGLAYAASIGGMGTLIGTPPNVAFAAMFREFYPDQTPISFFEWMRFGCPVAAAMLAAAWVLLTYFCHPVGAAPLLGGRNVVREQLHALGPMSKREWRIVAIFLAAATLWITREPMPGVGWAPALGVSKLPDGTRLVDDSTVAMAMALLCFIVPTGLGDGRRLLQWESTTRLPWGVLLLFGGGLAMAEGLQRTGLAAHLGGELAGRLDGLSTLAMMIVIVAGTVLLSEFASNLACVTMLLPVLASTAAQLQINPLLLMVPATLAASCGFMLPVATAPNAIVYGSGRIRMSQMMRAGLALDLIGVVIIVVLVMLLNQTM